MPRYYFHVRDGTSDPDLDGTELPDLLTAKVEAVRLFGHILAEEAPGMKPGESWQMAVRDDHGLLLFQLDFVLAVAPAARPMTTMEVPL